MIIERDLSIIMDDGIELKADIFRPDLDQPVPVIMTSGPYGKGVPPLQLVHTFGRTSLVR